MCDVPFTDVTDWKCAMAVSVSQSLTCRQKTAHYYHSRSLVVLINRQTCIHAISIVTCSSLTMV